ncbi:MAG: peptidase M6, partial [Actinomycetes bacterium]
PSADPAIGTVKPWVALNEETGYYLKYFTLRAVGEHIEIWTASDKDGNPALAFPTNSTGACRNTVFDGGEITVSDEQVNNFVKEFDTNIYPKESAAFSVPASRDGSNAILGDGWQGDGDKIVTLVDNVRDANYYDPSTPDGQTYIAGFFSSSISAYVDRNVMTIDAFDWLHRTGTNPPDDTNAIDCEYAGTTPRPHLYEGTFAHEYQHLLENDSDAGEVNWVNEGLSDLAQTLVGYVKPGIPADQKGADGHLACFQGYLDPKFGGPENSLTRWSDQGGPEILCDYGAAYSFMEYLHGHFGGDAFMSALHRDPGHGLVGLQDVLDRFVPGTNALDVVHDWQAAMALDAQLEAGGKLLGGVGGAGSAAALTIPSMSAKINWDNSQAYDSLGAPTNGADYVRLRDEAGDWLNSRQLNGLTFSGAATYPTDPVEWTVDDGRLYSGKGDELDRAIARDVTVPAENPTLSAELQWGTELGWDFAMVQVYDPDTREWVSLSNDDTTNEHDPAAAGNIVGNLPGFTGPSSDADETVEARVETFDLQKWAGKTITIAFRYMTDAATTGPGFWVDNVKVGDTLISDGEDLDVWKSLTQAHPIPVASWSVQLIAYGGNASKVWHSVLPVTSDSKGHLVATLPKGDLQKLRAFNFDTVAVLIGADDPGEQASAYPTYTLTASGVVQPGGGA